MSAKELVQYLLSPQEAISNVALEGLLPFTVSSSGQPGIFMENDFQGVRALKDLSLNSQNSETILNTLIALINLTDNESIRFELASDAKALAAYTKRVAATPKLGYVKYLCMLLTNLSKETATLDVLRGPLLTALVLTFSKAQNIQDEDYDFLGFVFSEFARLDPTSIAKLIPYLLPSLVNGSVNRRRIVAATIKNAMFDINLHGPLTHDMPLIETIMVSLEGPEPFDHEDLAKLPRAVSSEWGTNKKREDDSETQLSLVESLLLLSSSQVGRDVLRAKNTYLIVRELHKATNNAKVLEACEKYVNMTMRGDPEPRKRLVGHDGDSDDVVEVI